MTTGTATITTIHFAILAILAALTIAGILWGIRLKHRRVVAERMVAAHAEEAGVPLVDADGPADPTRAAEPYPVPLAPAPPPPADAALIATPPPMGAPATQDALRDEPIAPAAPYQDSPATLAAGADAVRAPAPEDGALTQIKGLGPKVQARLAELGITRVGQLAALTPADAQALDTQLGPFTGRLTRDRWVEQARLLAAGDRAGFEAVFGRL